MSEKKVGKRLLTWVLVLVMTLSLLPLNVLADYVPYDSSEGESNSWVTKTAEWVDAKAGIAKITIRVQGDASSTSSTITPTDIVLVIDTSGSMRDNNKMKNAKAAAKAFVDKFFGSNASDVVKTNVEIGIVSYDDNISDATDLTNKKNKLDRAIGWLYPSGGTNIQAAIRKAQTMLDNGRANAAKVMVVLTDGEPTYSYQGSTATSIVGDTETYGVNESNFSYIVSDFMSGFGSRIGDGSNYSLNDWNGDYWIGENHIDNNGVGTVSQAYAAKKAGTVIYGIGYGIGDQGDAYDVMNSVASVGKYYGASESNDSINDIFDSIANDITTFAAYNAVLTDTMGEGFTALATDDYPMDSNATLMSDGTVYWEVADELDNQEHEITFYVQYDTEGELSDSPSLPTNKEARLDYDTDKSGTSSGSVTANVPTVKNHAHSVTYNYADGSTPSDKQLYWLGKNVTVKDDPIRRGYNFTGWTVDGYTFDEGYPKAGDTFNMPDNDVTFTAKWVEDYNWTQDTKYTVKYTIEGVEQTADKLEVTGTAWINDNPAKIAIAEGGIPAPADKYTGYKLDPNNPTYPVAGDEVENGSVYTVNYIKDNSKTQDTKYTVKYTIEGVEQTADKLEVTGTAWINDNPAKIAIAEGGIPAPANKYAGYKLDSSNPTYPAAGTEVNSGSEYTVNYVKDNSKTQNTKYTVKYTIEGVEQTADKLEVTGTAWINDNPAKIAIAEGGIPAPANKYVGYKLDSSNPTYPAADTMVETGSIFTVNYVKDDSQWATVTYVISGGHGSITSGRTSYEVLKGTKWSEAGITDPTTTADSGYKFNGWTGKVDTIEKNVTVIGTFSRIGGNHPRPKPTVTIEDDDALGLNTTDHFAYIVGYGNGEVRPQNNITRAEVATIFFRLLTDDVRDENLTKTNRYSDVAATSWYNTAVSTLSSMGIITGYPDGTFRPNAAITRAEFAAIAARFDHDGDKTAAKFSDIANHWAKDEISIAYNNGWITGYPDGTFGPQRDITRAETMTLVNRVLNRQPETEDDLLPNMTVWTDNANPNAWYYLAVQEATNSHYYKFKTNSKYEKWTELRETRDWTQLEK